VTAFWISNGISIIIFDASGVGYHLNLSFDISQCYSAPIHLESLFIVIVSRVNSERIIPGWFISATTHTHTHTHHTHTTHTHTHTHTLTTTKFNSGIGIVKLLLVVNMAELTEVAAYEYAQDGPEAQRIAAVIPYYPFHGWKFVVALFTE
jgi:hypothetical protein